MKPSQSGGDWQRALVKRIVEETPGCRTFELELEDVKVQPGQYAAVAVTINGVRHMRCYSFSHVTAFGEPPSLTVKRHEAGVVSAWFNDECKLGDAIEVGKPTGTFVVRPGTSPLLFLAAGSGITPIYAMLRSALLETDRRVTLLYANRAVSEIIFANQLDRLRREFPLRFTLRRVATAESRAAFEAVLSRTIAEMPTADIYLCGPAGFMRTCEREAALAGIGPGRILSESFVSDETVPLDGEHIPVIVERRGTEAVAVWSRVGQTLLHALVQSGAAHVGICGGQASCGTCRVSIGAPWHDTLAPASRSERRLLDVLPDNAATHRLACQVRLTAAHSNLVLTPAPL